MYVLIIYQKTPSSGVFLICITRYWLLHQANPFILKTFESTGIVRGLSARRWYVSESPRMERWESEVGKEGYRQDRPSWVQPQAPCPPVRRQNDMVSGLPTNDRSQVPGGAPAGNVPASYEAQRPGYSVVAEHARSGERMLTPLACWAGVRFTVAPAPCLSQNITAVAVVPGGTMTTNGQHPAASWTTHCPCRQAPSGQFALTLQHPGIGVFEH